MRDFFSRVISFLSVFVVVAAGILFIIGALSWTDQLSDFLQKNREQTEVYERMEYLKDSLTVEELKRKLNENQEDTTKIYSIDKITDEDIERIRIPIDSNNQD